AAQDDAVVPLRITGELEVGEPAYERAERDLGLGPRQRRAKAVMDAVPERHVLAGVGPGEGELVGRRPPPPRGAGRRPAAREHEAAGRDGGPGDVEVARSDPA